MVGAEESMIDVLLVRSSDVDGMNVVDGPSVAVSVEFSSGVDVTVLVCSSDQVNIFCIITKNYFL